MQATIVIPYPGPSFMTNALKITGLRLIQRIKAFDMRSPVMRIPFSEKRLLELTQELYSSFFSPQYIFRKIKSIKSWDDVKYYFMSAKKFLGHLKDFDKSQKRS